MAELLFAGFDVAFGMNAKLHRTEVASQPVIGHSERPTLLASSPEFEFCLKGCAGGRWIYAMLLAGALDFVYQAILTGVGHPCVNLIIYRLYTVPTICRPAQRLIGAAPELSASSRGHSDLFPYLSAGNSIDRYREI